MINVINLAQLTTKGDVLKRSRLIFKIEIALFNFASSAETLLSKWQLCQSSAKFKRENKIFVIALLSL